IGVLMDDHREGRHLNGAMRAAAERLAAGDDHARAELISVATQFVELLRGHIDMEDSAVFPMAEQMLAGPARAEVSSAIERIVRDEEDQGLRARFLDLAASIERQAAG
ncbi:MAG: hemerythrin domain-containing protein, partial [Gemmatimonadota bacterium]|nr:hemerythrin domain-containing protein [Gemmatimonadota bacterium]